MTVWLSLIKGPTSPISRNPARNAQPRAASRGNSPNPATTMPVENPGRRQLDERGGQHPADLSAGIARGA